MRILFLPLAIVYRAIKSTAYPSQISNTSQINQDFNPSIYLAAVIAQNFTLAYRSVDSIAQVFRAKGKATEQIISDIMNP